MIRTWRSLRAQVLLWTVLPLTILLIAVSLTGVTTHQNSMRNLAREDNAQLATAVASALAQQVEIYVVGLDAASRLLAHHQDDPTMRSALLEETSAVLGGIEIVALDAEGQPLASSSENPPEWAASVPALQSGANEPVVADNGILVRVEAPDQSSTLVASVPISAFLSLLDDVAAVRDGIQIDVTDGAGMPLLSKGIVPSLATEAGQQDHADGDWLLSTAPVAGTSWQVVLRESWHARALPLIRFEQAMPFVLVVAAAVSFLTLYFGLRLVVGPLRQLEGRARRIGEGEFEAAIDPVGGVDEIENVRAAMDQMATRIQASQRALERYLHATTQAQEEERTRLARELHDETVQGLIALDHRLQKAQRTLGRDPGMLKEEVTDLRQMVRVAMEEVRRFSLALRPVYLEDLGLCPALELLAIEAGVDFSMTGEQRRLDPVIELALYRIAQESINNARRHAQAQRIELLLAFKPSNVSLSVSDDGIGFTPPPHLGSLSREGHFGLMGIQERVDLMGARLSIDSTLGKGTTVSVSVSI